MSQSAPESSPFQPPVTSDLGRPAASESQGPAHPQSRPDLALSPFCLHLQSKKLFFSDGPPMKVEDVLDASRHCWCRKTMQALGPDGDVVDPRDCQAGRTCFESVL